MRLTRKNLGIFLWKIAYDIRSQGLSATWGQASRYLLTPAKAYRVADDFDDLNGVKTAGKVQPWNLEIESPNAKYASKYEPANPEFIRKAINLMGEDLCTFTFLDLGCGKGRALILAHQLGFKRIMGVEFCPELAEIGKENCRRAGMTAEIVTADVSDFDLPAEDLVLFMFDPFKGPVMCRTLDQISRHKQKLIVVYVNPQLKGLFDKCSRLKRVGISDNAIIWRLA